MVDFDPSSALFYPPVDLNHPHLLAQDGLPASEGDPQFHQQMTYAVAMGTIRQFEVALGRGALWAPHLRRDRGGEVIPGSGSRTSTSLGCGSTRTLCGRRMRTTTRSGTRCCSATSRAEGADVGRNLPGGTVFACLSYDIIAHETTHALLDGLHRYLIEPSNPDVFAFHEAFADVVALFQHFSHPEVLRYQLARTRGDVDRREAARRAGRPVRRGDGQPPRPAAVTSASGRRADGKEKWKAIKPDRMTIHEEREPHDRGAILVAALFRAFTRTSTRTGSRTCGGSRPAGPACCPTATCTPTWSTGLADEAAKSARHMLTMCVRALDYVPPVDLTFGEYLRALITADYDLVQDDDRGYRVSVVSAFRDWGIYPGDVRSLSVDSLLWDPPEMDVQHPSIHPKEFFRESSTRWTGKLDGERRDAYSVDGWTCRTMPRRPCRCMSERQFHDS